MMFRQPAAYALAFAATFAAAPQGARAKDDAKTPVPAVTDVVACRAVADQSARLACFDRASAALEAATASGAVIVVAREDVRKTRRGLFGFGSTIGSMFNPLFGKSGDEDEVKRIDTTIESVSTNREGEWVLRFAEGGLWQQNDVKSFVMSPKAGQKATIQRSPFGSYSVSVNGQPGVKMRRVQ